MSNLNDNINIIDENGEVKSLPRAVIEANKIDYISIDEDKFIAMANKLRTANLIYLPEVTEDDKIGISTMSKSLGLQYYDDEREFNALLLQDFTTTGNTLAILNPEVTTIGALMFRNSKNIKNLVLPFVKNIETGAFLYILENQISTIYAPKCKTLDISAFKPGQWDENNTITSINLDSITEAPEALFSNHLKLTNISFSNLITIRTFAFGYCNSLTSAYFPNVINIEEDAFEYCSSLKFVDFPKVKEIGYGVFEYCNNIEKISLPEVVQIGKGAFLGISKVVALDLPKVETIGDQAFMQYEDVSRLTTVNLPRVTFIGPQAFGYIESLTTVTIGTSSVCELTDSDSFPTTTKIYVLDNLVEQYKTKYPNMVTQFHPISELPS